MHLLSEVAHTPLSSRVYSALNKDFLLLNLLCFVFSLLFQASLETDKKTFYLVVSIFVTFILFSFLDLSTSIHSLCPALDK